MPQQQPQNDDNARQRALAYAQAQAEEEARQRSSGGGASKGGSQLPPWLVALISLVLLAASGYLAFGQGIQTLPQGVFFTAATAIGIGGLTTMLSGDANFTLGKWGKATGYVAVFLIVFCLLLNAMGLVKIPWEQSSLLIERLHYFAAENFSQLAC